MARNLGDYTPQSVVDFMFNTHVSGAPTTLAGSPVVSVYRTSNPTESATGVALTVDFDGRTGLHHVTITFTSNASFYTTGGQYSCVLTAGTVGGNSVVGVEVAYFTIGMQTVPMQGPLGAIPFLGIVDNGVAQAATSNSVTLRAANTLEADVNVGGTLLISGGTAGLWQTGLGADFNAGTDVLLLDNGWSGGITPTGTIQYVNFATAVDSSSSTAALAAIQADIDDIQARLPASLLGGKMEAHVTVIAGEVLQLGGTGNQDIGGT